MQICWRINNETWISTILFTIGAQSLKIKNGLEKENKKIGFHDNKGDLAVY